MKPAIAISRPASVTNLWQKYCQQLDRRPLLTRSLTGVVGAALGDAMAQAASRRMRSVRPRTPTTLANRDSLHTTIVQEAAAYDWMRTARLALYAGIVGAPIGYKWYQLLDKMILPATPKTAAAVLLKTFCDQALFAPVATAMFLGAVRCMEGRSSQAVATVQTQLWPCLKANYMLWPAAHIINFALVPSSQRILYVNVIAVFWGAFMSQMVNNQDAARPAPAVPCPT